MGLIYVVDTNVVSEIMRVRPNKNVQQKWQAHVADIAITATTWHELYVGVERMPASLRRDALAKFLLSEIQPVVPILPYDQQAAEWHAIERARLMRIGKTPPYVDGQIAAITAVNHLILVTRNTPDFAYFQSLPVENWFT